LRTNETLGYIVYCCRVISYTSAIGLRFMVKGEGNPAYVQLRLDNFYREFRTNKLAKMTQEELNQQIEALITQNEKPDYDVFSESDRYWEWIDRGLYRFYDKMEENKVLRNATKEKLVEFWDEHLDPLCPEHGSLIVHIYSAKITTPSLQDRATYRDVVIALKGCLERDGVTGLSYADVHEIVSTVVASNKSIKGGDAINEFKRLVVSKVPGVDQDALAKAFGSEEAYSRIALNMAVSDYTNNVTTEHSAAVVAAAPAAAPTTTTLPVDAIIIYCTPTGDHVFSDIRKYREGLEVSGLLPYSHPLTPKYP
ncbi:metalloprotease, partial [Spiromyces aspiralis]